MKLSNLLYLPLFICFVAYPVHAEDTSYISKLANLDIKDLMDQEVTSVLRKEQSLSNAAAAVFVITQEDIRRSGSRSIPELLRMVPGVTVTRLPGNNYQVTVRGFDSDGSSKLLILIDGRSVYSPAFSGVFWDAQDIIAEDIDRIEVIRGPGAVSWGENAVNGVINIITKNSKDTPGWRIIGALNNQPSGSTSVTYGGKTGDDTFYRLFGKFIQRDNLKFVNGDNADDNSHNYHGGFRMDSSPTNHDALTWQGDIYNGADSLKTNILNSFTPPFTIREKNTTEVSGGNTIFRWVRKESPDSAYTVQSYYDRTNRRNLQYSENRDTYDLDLQHHYHISDTHDLVYGADLRLTSDSFDNSLGVRLFPKSRTDSLFNTFVQDEVLLMPNTLSIIPGIKLGYNDYSQFDYQPALKLLWTPSHEDTVWGSVSRAIRSPARIDEDIAAYGTPTVGSDGTVEVPAFFGRKSFDAEELLAYEVGYRTQASKTVSADIATFYHQYNNLLSVEPGQPFIEHSPGPDHEVMPFFLNNKLHGSAYGAEAFSQWKPRKDLDFSAGYSITMLHFEPDPNSFDIFGKVLEKETPQNQATFRAHWNLTDSLQLNTALYYVDSIPAFSVPSYIRTDLHLGYAINDSLLLDVAAQNLTSDGHREWGSDITGIKIDRTYYVKLTYSFR